MRFVSGSPMRSELYWQLPGGLADLISGGDDGRDGDGATVPAGGWQPGNEWQSGEVKALYFFFFLPCRKQGVRRRAGRLLWENSFQYAKSVILLLLAPLKITRGSC